MRWTGGRKRQRCRRRGKLHKAVNCERQIALRRRFARRHGPRRRTIPDGGFGEVRLRRAMATPDTHPKGRRFRLNPTRTEAIQPGAPRRKGKEPMLKKTLSVLTLLAAGAGAALGQDASSSTYPAARLQAPGQYSANSYSQPVTPPGRPSPYSNYQAT